MSKLKEWWYWKRRNAIHRRYKMYAEVLMFSWEDLVTLQKMENQEIEKL